mgnify:CR=1 FL=1
MKPLQVRNDAQREQLRVMYNAHLRDVWHTLRRLGVPQRDLEDACHETFMVAFRRLPDFDPARPAKPWLCGIAWRVAAAWRRRAGARLVHVGIDRDPADPAPDVTEALERHGQLAVVNAALAALPEAQRDVFVLHELDGLSMPEIAEAIETPINTLYSRLRLARARFAAEIHGLVAARDGPAPTSLDMNDPATESKEVAHEPA